jgi:hypothetical protein
VEFLLFSQIFESHLLFVQILLVTFQDKGDNPDWAFYEVLHSAKTPTQQILTIEVLSDSHIHSYPKERLVGRVRILVATSYMIFSRFLSQLFIIYIIRIFHQKSTFFFNFFLILQLFYIFLPQNDPNFVSSSISTTYATRDRIIEIESQYQYDTPPSTPNLILFPFDFFKPSVARPKPAYPYIVKHPAPKVKPKINFFPNDSTCLSLRLNPKCRKLLIIKGYWGVFLGNSTHFFPKNLILSLFIRFFLTFFRFYTII